MVMQVLSKINQIKKIIVYTYNKGVIMGTISEEKNNKISEETIQSYLNRKFQGKELIQIYKHLDDIIATPFFDEDKTHRYGLIIEKGQQSEFSKKIFDFDSPLDKLIKNIKEVENTVCVIMLNPSYADEYIADKSTYRLEKCIFSKGKCENLPVDANDMARIIIVNKFSKICTTNFDPTEDTGERELNLKYLERAVAFSSIVILAWGASVDQDIDEKIYSLIENNKSKNYYKSKYHPSIKDLFFRNITIEEIRKLLLGA